MITYFLNHKKIPDEISPNLLDDHPPPQCLLPLESECPSCKTAYNEESLHFAKATVSGIGKKWTGKDYYSNTLSLT